MSHQKKPSQDISFFSEDVEDTKSKTRYISHVIAFIYNRQFHYNIMGLSIILASTIFFYLGASMIYSSIFNDSPETIISRSVYTKEIQEKISPEQVKSFFVEVKKHIASESEIYLNLFPQLSQEDAKTLSINASPNFIYTTLMENNKSLENKMITFLMQLQSPAIIDTYDKDEIKHFQKILWLIKTDNYKSSHIIGNNMSLIISNNQIMQSIIKRNEFNKIQQKEKLKEELKNELPEVIKNSIKINQQSSNKTNI